VVTKFGAGLRIGVAQTFKRAPDNWSWLYNVIKKEVIALKKVKIEVKDDERFFFHLLFFLTDDSL